MIFEGNIYFANKSEKLPIYFMILYFLKTKIQSLILVSENINFFWEFVF